MTFEGFDAAPLIETAGFSPAEPAISRAESLDDADTSWAAWAQLLDEAVFEFPGGAKDGGMRAAFGEEGEDKG
jgi:hypothetical protein